MKLRVLIADPDPDLQRTITAALSQERDMEAAGFSSGGTETLSQIQSLRPDVVLLELVQPRLDGLSVLRRLAEAESAPPVVVLTGFVNAAIVAECARLGAAYFIPKPCDPGALLQCLRQYAKAETRPPAAVPGLAPAPKVPAPPPAQLESAVTNLLHEMGVPAHIKGFQYLRAGILFTIRGAGSVAGITKVLYPEIAKRFSATPACVERAMRHAIEIAWNRGDFEMQQKIFRGTISGAKGKPTNGEFIALLAEHIALRFKSANL